MRGRRTDRHGGGMVGDDAPARREIVDRGLQIERTRLSWKRTMLSSAVFGLLALRMMPLLYGKTGVVAGVVAFAVAVLVCAVYAVHSMWYTRWFIAVDAASGKAANRNASENVHDRLFSFLARHIDGLGMLSIAIGISTCAAVGLSVIVLQ